jgi:hypothetical protein
MISLNKVYKENFVLSVEKLNAIVKKIEEHLKKKKNDTELVYKVERFQESLLETNDIQDVLSDDNAKGKEIFFLEIQALSKDITQNLDPLCILKFNSRSKDIQVELLIQDADKSWCNILYKDLDIYIKRSLTSLKSKSIINFVLSYFAKTLPILLFSICLILYYLSKPKRNYLIENASVAMLAFDLMACMLGLLLFYELVNAFIPFEKWRYFLVNDSAFYWGDQIEIHDKKKNLKANIFWGIIVAFIVSVLASFFNSFFI